MDIVSTKVEVIHEIKSYSPMALLKKLSAVRLPYLYAFLNYVFNLDKINWNKN